MVRGALAWGALAALPAAGVAYAVRGNGGFLSVLIAVGLVLSNAGIAALVSALAGRWGATAAGFAALPSFAARMAGVFAALVALRGASFVDEPTFALAFGLAVTAVLVWESMRWKRTPWLALTIKEKS